MAYGRVLEGALQGYAWGRTDGLRAWTGAGTGGPEAELWFGTHPAAPSRTLQSIPDGAPAGDATLLVKILAAGRPLSIQVHPSRAAIDAIRGIGRGDLLVDEGEKAELLVAVERMEAFAGLRALPEARDLVATLGLHRAADLLAAGDVAGAVTDLLSGAVLPDLDAGLAALPCVERAIVAKAIAAFPGDRGLPAVFLLQPHVLEPGDALCVPVGVVHAYVDGVGVEVMTSCDNVLRLGLSPKTVCAEAALLALDADRRPDLVRGARARGRYDSPSMPFVVERVEDTSVPVGDGTIVLSLAGALTVSSAHGSLEARSGQAVFVERDAGWTAAVRGVAFVATPRDPNLCRR